MSLSDPFIKRPVLSTVCSIIIVLAGLISFNQLPIAYTPDISSSQITVSASFPGGNASLVEQALTEPLENAVNNVPGVEYITSSSGKNSTSIQIYLTPETDPDIAQLNVQNNIERIKPTLPEATRNQGVTIDQSTDNMVSVYIISSSDGQYDTSYLSTIYKNQLEKQLKLVPGVGQISGPTDPQFELRLDPDLLTSFNLSAEDVISQVNLQSIGSSAGDIGAVNYYDKGTYAYPVLIKKSGYLQTIEDFNNMIVRKSEAGSLIRLKDVGNTNYIAAPASYAIGLDGHPAIPIIINQKSNTNAVQIASDVETIINNFKGSAPPGVVVHQIVNKKDFIERSQGEASDSLGLAIILVLVTLLIFLQNWRTTLIPALAVPISLVGTFVFISLFDFSLNILTYMGIILATGLVVDDAILVIELISKKIELGLTPFKAALESMNELFAAIITTSLVLIALFVPITLVAGSIGTIYQQFAITIIFAVAISTFNALTFSPMMAGLILRQSKSRPPKASSGLLGGVIVGLAFGYFTKSLFGIMMYPIGVLSFGFAGFQLKNIYILFNRFYNRLENTYLSILTSLINRRRIVVGALAVIFLLTVSVYSTVPKATTPSDDGGNIYGSYELSEASSLANTMEISSQIQKELIKEKSITSAVISAGSSDPNAGFFYLGLKAAEDRPEKDQSNSSIANRLTIALSKLDTARPTMLFPVPAIQMGGNGIDMHLVDKSNQTLTFNELNQSALALSADAGKSDEIQSINVQFSPDSPAYELTINRTVLNNLNVDFNNAVKNIQALAGSTRAGQTNYGGLLVDVYAIADSNSRMTIDDLLRYQVKDNDGKLVSVSQFAEANLISSPKKIDHYNLNRAVKIQAQQQSNSSALQAIDVMKRSFEKFNFPNMSYAFTGMARIEDQSGGQIQVFFALAAVTVFLVLSALYESYTTPISILLTVPLAIFGSVLFVMIRGMSIDIFSQVGLLMLIGLAAKNAILIVETANEKLTDGIDLIPAAIEASKQRLRPILMTTFASLAGFIPLVLSNSGAQRSIGTVVFGGLFMGTILSLGAVPPIYIMIKNLTTRLMVKKTQP